MYKRLTLFDFFSDQPIVSMYTTQHSWRLFPRNNQFSPIGHEGTHSFKPFQDKNYDLKIINFAFKKQILFHKINPSLRKSFRKP